MIGYYVHHVGSGHLHRARAIADAVRQPVTGLSSLPRPQGWRGHWIELARDDVGPTSGDVTAGGRLHWAPTHDPGLRGRMSRFSSWIDSAAPALVVVDVSAEVAVLARLHGVPVISFVLPGERDDEAHLLGYGVSAALVAAWPPAALAMLPGLPAATAARVEHVGGISRFPVDLVRERRPGPPRVVLLSGEGGGAPTPAEVEEARASAPDWTWTVIGGPAGTWVENPFPALCDADVVVCQAGQNTIAEVAAARRPAIVVPADRPHDEQLTTAGALAAGGWPVLVEPEFPVGGWPARLAEAAALDCRRWESWCDDHGAVRAAAVLQRVAEDHALPGVLA